MADEPTLMGAPIVFTDRAPSLAGLQFGDWSHLCTQGGATAQGVTLEKLLALKREMDSLPRPDFDALVCLPVAYRRLRAEAPEGAMTCDRLYGMPVYFAADAFEAACVVRQLRREGRRARVFAAPGDPQEIPDLDAIPGEGE